MTIGVLGVVLVFAVEPLAALVPATGPLHVVGTLLVAAGPLPPFIVGYPVVPWLAIMMMGWGTAEVARLAPQAFPGGSPSPGWWRSESSSSSAA